MNGAAFEGVSVKSKITTFAFFMVLLLYNCIIIIIATVNKVVSKRNHLVWTIRHSPHLFQDYF